MLTESHTVVSIAAGITVDKWVWVWGCLGGGGRLTAAAGRIQVQLERAAS